MICEQVRTALSARLDGEPADQAPELTDAHLVDCAGCREWQQRAVELTRSVRLHTPEAPDLTRRIMAAVAAQPTTPVVTVGPTVGAGEEAQARRRILRLAVAVAAAVQLALAVPVLIGAMTGTSTSVGLHASREMASFDIAVAVGFLLAAAHPVRARAFLPVAIVLAGLLAATSGFDLVRGATTFPHEIGHLVALVQAGLLWALGRSVVAELPDRVAPAGSAPGSVTA